MISKRIRFGILSSTVVAVFMMSPLAASMPAFAATNSVNGGFVELQLQVLPSNNNQLSNMQVTAFGSEHVVNVGGGTWDYGTAPAPGGKVVWSKYLHRSLKHHTSVMISGKAKSSQIQPPNVWADASLVSPYFWDIGYAFWGTDGL